jgi:hypothetical protein
MARKMTPDQEQKVRQMRKTQEFIPMLPSRMGSEIRQYLREANPVLRAYVMADELMHTTFQSP